MGNSANSDVWVQNDACLVIDLSSILIVWIRNLRVPHLLNQVSVGGVRIKPQAVDDVEVRPRGDLLVIRVQFSELPACLRERPEVFGRVDDRDPRKRLGSH